MSEGRAKLRDWAIWLVRGGCYSQAALSFPHHGSTLAQDYCGVSESTGLGRDCFSQKRALSLTNAYLPAVWAMLAPSAERAKGEGSSRSLIMNGACSTSQQMAFHH